MGRELTDAGEDGAPRISRLFVHPVKSCRGVEVREAKLEARGLAGDREWMVTDPRGRFVTGREQPRLCLVQPRLDQDALVLAAAGMPELRIARSPEGGPRLRVRVWDDLCDATADAEASAWISEYLGGAFRLVHMPADVVRPVDPAYAPKGARVGFADGFPLLLLGAASVRELEARAAARFDVRRFRPSVVVEGSAPHAEDDWRSLHVGEIPFLAVKRCSRCVMTTVDPDTAETTPEPLRTLARYRARDGKVFFGMNLVHLALGALRVGDRLRLEV